MTIILKERKSIEAVKVEGKNSCDITKMASENETIETKTVALIQDMVASKEAGITKL